MKVVPFMSKEEREWRRRWPCAFNDRRLPLQIGIHLDMGIAPVFNPAMRRWCTHPEYLRNILRPGAKRINLYGQPVELISNKERQIVLELLGFPYERRINLTTFDETLAQEICSWFNNK